MTVYLAFTEPSDQPGIEGSFSTSTSATYKNSWSRAAWYVRDSVDALVSLPSALTEGWIHYHHAGKTTTNSVRLRYVVGLMGQNDTIWGGTHSITNSSDVGFDGVFTTLQSVSERGYFPVDINFRINAVDGFCYVYVDSVLVFSFEGDTALAGITGITGLSFGACATFNNIDRTDAISEVLVSDQPTIGAKVITAGFSAAGALTDWTGAVGDINAFNSADSTSIASNVNGNISTFVKPAIPTLAVDDTISAVALNFNCNVEPASPVENISPVVRSGAVNYPQTAIAAPATVEARSVILHNNPATSAAWTEANFNSAEFGWRADT